ncbi:hypothetical protein BvCmsHHP001_02482 [Escherichia coli]|nr:hypothetical protein BvCmsHHP001_02482 [Escherichia coli]
MFTEEQKIRAIELCSKEPCRGVRVLRITVKEIGE